MTQNTDTQLRLSGRGAVQPQERFSPIELFAAAVNSLFWPPALPVPFTLTPAGSAVLEREGR